ncbi:hypothetical protein L1987_25058 [Smallanthus sonchifolius]|uniref:Uncharacterized protein n=1 Tax=Smallanthus sonchifolius TaxID=185202 RepID=A0ACB9INX2_9ASTR|nr:hypothetical protein L1987_25058 [Smallanthus sonchifolius]
MPVILRVVFWPMICKDCYSNFPKIYTVCLSDNKDFRLNPFLIVALRLSSHLLLGVVDDCSEALLKVKHAFRSTAVDLPHEESTAPYHLITMPETSDIDDFELPDNDLQGLITVQGNRSHFISISYPFILLLLPERFGDDDASGLDLDERPDYGDGVYARVINLKKGPLGTIWIAAHLERKLRKNQVADTNISVSGR